MPVVTNIAAYKFARLENLKALRERLLVLCKERALRGTILLAPEGVNLFIAGDAPDVEVLLAELRAIPGLEDLKPKVSESDHQPFSRMLVRLKKEIIAFGVEGIDPAAYTSPRIESQTLKQWLDEGKPVILFDTRNDYEVKLGTFAGAIPAGIDHFRDFPAAVARLPEEMKNAPVVTFCTGGIRCEKAAPFMERMGFKDVYQLEGGILKYFEETGGAHYDGECFVFDQRVGVDPGLRETGSAVCFACQSPLTAEEQADARYVENVSCPHCFRSDQALLEERIAARQEAIRRVTTPLPGSVAYENRRPIRISAPHEGWAMIDVLCAVFPHFERETWLETIAAGLVLDARENRISPDRKVRAGEQFMRIFPGTIEPPVNADIRVIYEDEAILVLEKPAPLPTHSSGRFHRNTLQSILHAAWHPEKPGPAHRLDSNTSGVLVCTRTRHFAKLLQPQFSRGEVAKTYLARVHGWPVEDSFRVDAPISDVPTALGAREIEQDAQSAVTDFEVLTRNDDGTATLRVKPFTGRTHQIRIHLWHASFPIVGDPVYLPEGQRGSTTSMEDASPMLLHAWRISFAHPSTRDQVTFETPVPAWAR
ncbi:MAG: rluA [Akkermansiaceae bacterium]|nr:rluA [Akkermansiaceae bacterium]